MAIAIYVDGVTKQFTLRRNKSLKNVTIDLTRSSPEKRGKGKNVTFKALDNVGFTVQEGEAVGLMGLNGSGKSTLLKLISGVMKPDHGTILTRGRVAGLIEVGAGLHKDLTGRENVYLNGAILGMTEKEIDRKFDEIVAFSEVEEFLDNQVRHYSSGQFMRLAFSTAVHTDCDIFLIDEVLAVGDQPFKRKCIRKIKELKDEGRTMFYVSHNAQQVIRLCDRGLVLKRGNLAFDGSSKDAVHYLGYDQVDDDDDASEP
jgi:ABC-2 type transport system ATP-binding protein